MINLYLFIYILLPATIISYYHEWPIGVFGTLAYMITLFYFPKKIKEIWNSLLYIFLLALPLLYSLFLVIGGVITGSLLLVFSLVMARRVYKSYKNSYLRIYVDQLWEEFVFYLPEEEPVYTFEGTVPLASVQTLETVDMPAKKFLVVLEYTANGVDYQQEHEFLWTSFISDLEDKLESYEEIAGQPILFYYNPKNPLEVMRAPSKNYSASHKKKLLQQEKAIIIVPVLSSLLGVIFIILGLTG